MPALYAQSWLILGAGLMVLGLWQALRTERWRAISNSHLNSWLACCVFIMLIWQLNAQIQAGISFHILGSTALTLIAGRNRALIGIAAILLIEALFSRLEWQNIGLYWLLLAAIPCYISSYLLQLSQQRLPLNFFTYVFVNCFAAAAISMWAYGLFHCVVLASSGSYSWGFLQDEILPYYFLMGWPEAFSTGLNLTLLVVWQPQWVASFDDAKYLQKKE
ncbi:energy-coupling factor ABC transporter permease [Chitinibacter bivalviorum]|uniref:Energy-coupling factor ABC transporter permease n=1 Tax=Chitinibacter bivalviorum TaxID=2739434 RepID=A0A7H9BGT3_9NEIS|nr:energy-coupling factor ABC transporter permease [Chitinibacter bivalviorum]QLG87827.1 energy-coupling factor ABC transporter permease [Chitinibacter bivalviorum]